MDSTQQAVWSQRSRWNYQVLDCIAGNVADCSPSPSCRLIERSGFNVSSKLCSGRLIRPASRDCRPMLLALAAVQSLPHWPSAITLQLQKGSHPMPTTPPACLLSLHPAEREQPVRSGVSSAAGIRRSIVLSEDCTRLGRRMPWIMMSCR